MKSVVRDSFDIGEDAFWRELFFNQAFLERVYKDALSCQSLEFLEDKEDATGRTRRLAFRQTIDAPAPVRKIFGETAGMEERGRFDAKTGRWRFELIPEKMADKVRISGETWVEPKGEGKIERVTELEFSVSIFGIGSIIEKFMASATRENFEKQARFIRSTLAERAAK